MLLDPRRMVMPQFNEPVLINGPRNVTPRGLVMSRDIFERTKGGADAKDEGGASI